MIKLPSEPDRPTAAVPATPGKVTGRDLKPSILLRGAVFWMLWICLTGSAPLDIAIGVLAAAVATWASILLWPAGGGFSYANLPRYALRFLWQSIGAGVEVAKYAFSPSIDLKPGFATYRTSVLPGMGRDALCTVMSLQPGKLPVETAADGTMLIHCLNVRQAVASEFSDDEAAFLKVLNSEPSRG